MPDAYRAVIPYESLDPLTIGASGDDEKVSRDTLELEIPQANLLAAAVAAGDIDGDGNALLSGLLADAEAAFDQGDYEGAKDELEKFVEQTKKLHADGLTLKGKELLEWAKDLD